MFKKVYLDKMGGNMKVINGFKNEDIEILEDTEITGEVNGDVVVDGGELLVTGAIKGRITLNEGASLELIGECDEIRADAANINIAGTVYGDIIMRDTYLELSDNAVINGDIVDENDQDGVTYYDDYEEEYKEDDDEDDDSDDDNDEDDDYLDDEDDGEDDSDYNDDGEYYEE